MKTFKILVASVSVAILAVSCQKAVEEVAPVQEKAQLTTITCAFPSLTDQRGTKVSLGVDGTTGWEVGDKIVIYGNPSSSDASKRVVHEIEAGDIVNPEVAVFDVDLSSLDAQYNSGAEGTYFPYTVAYPYTDGQPYYLSTGNNNYGRSRFQNTNQLLMAGHVSDDNSSIVLNHLTAAITFSVEGDFDSYSFSGAVGTEVVGYSSFVVEMNRRTLGEGKYRQKYNDSGTTGPLTSIQGSVNGNGTAVNHIFLPVNAQDKGGSYDLDSQRYADVVYLPNGFTIKFFNGGDLKKYITSSAPLVIEPGHMINLGKLPEEALHDYEAPTSHDAKHPAIAGATDLSTSATKTANCYIVDGSVVANAGKTFKFPAVKGNGTASVGKVASVTILWETYNDENSVTANSVIKDVDFDFQDGDDYSWITFEMPSTLHAGNALIAAKDGADNILWSWHIWIPATTIAIGDYGISSVDIMSRNLGALVDTDASETTVDARSFGLIYQWGRKDPFLGSKRYNSSSQALVYGTVKSETTSQYTIAQSIANPTTFVVYKGDWMNPENTTLWTEGGDKSIYDPCPPGYRVPARNSSDPLWSKVVELDPSYGWEPNSTYGWWKLGTAVFPFAGYIDYSGGGVAHAYDRTRIWNAHKSTTGYAYDQQIWYESEAWKSEPGWQHRTACGNSVRCAVDE